MIISAGCCGICGAELGYDVERGEVVFSPDGTGEPCPHVVYVGTHYTESARVDGRIMQLGLARRAGWTRPGWEGFSPADGDTGVPLIKADFHLLEPIHGNGNLWREARCHIIVGDLGTTPAPSAIGIEE